MPKGCAKKKLKKYGHRSWDQKISATGPENRNTNSGFQIETITQEENNNRSSSRGRLADCYRRIVSRIANTSARRRMPQEPGQTHNTGDREPESCAVTDCTPFSSKRAHTVDLYEALQNLSNPKRLHEENFVPRNISFSITLHQNVTSVLIEMLNNQPDLPNRAPENRFQSKLLNALLIEGNFASKGFRMIEIRKAKEDEIKRYACRANDNSKTAKTRKIQNENILAWLVKAIDNIRFNTQYIRDVQPISLEALSDKSTAKNVQTLNKTKVSVPLGASPDKVSSVTSIIQTFGQIQNDMRSIEPFIDRPKDNDALQPWNSTPKSLSPEQKGCSSEIYELSRKSRTSPQGPVCVSFEVDRRRHSIFLQRNEFDEVMHMIMSNIVIKKQGTGVHDRFEVPNFSQSILHYERQDLLKIKIDIPGQNHLTVEAIPLPMVQFIFQKMADIWMPPKSNANAVDRAVFKSAYFIGHIQWPEIELGISDSAMKGVIAFDKGMLTKRRIPESHYNITECRHCYENVFKRASKFWYSFWKPTYFTLLTVKEDNELFVNEMKGRKINDDTEEQDFVNGVLKSEASEKRIYDENKVSHDRTDGRSNDTVPDAMNYIQQNFEKKDVVDGPKFTVSDFGKLAISEEHADRSSLGAEAKNEDPDDKDGATRAEELDDDAAWLAKIRSSTLIRRGEYQIFKNTVPENLDKIAVPVIAKESLLIETDEDGDEMVLSSGEFGKVYVARLIDTKEIIIAKLIKDMDFTEVLLEAKTQMYLSGLYTPKIKGIIGSPESTETMILQELCADGRTLHDTIQACDSGALILFEKHWLRLAHKLAISLDDMHQKGILHNDIKPNNILVELKPQDVRPVFIDFGWASFRRGEYFESNSGAELQSSNAKYLAPEVRKGRQSSPKSDIYSLGKIFMVIADLFLEDLHLLAMRMSADQPKRRPSLDTAADRLEELIVNKGF